ncbi:FGGY family carbohydrate kinase, partial [Varibaculum cambriense]|uniref:FGGY family carbohydrate kinase n=1 Tax=Varibaculum cambriense TaxID=184870 RepID=UPI00399BEC9F
MENKYVIGIDFGTLSGRAVVVRVSDGEVLASAVTEYAHGVMDTTLTAGDGQVLPPEFALEVPADYIAVLASAVPRAVKESGVDPKDVVAIGLDTTSASLVVTDQAGTPLCEKEEFKNNPHAYIKLWKHHGGQDQADRIVALAKERNEPWLGRYGGVLSSELALPKMLELYEKAPEVYQAAEAITDVMDWLTWKMTGVHTQTAGASGYKRMYQDGKYPDQEYLEALAPGFGEVFEQ